jgi:hypothetical protein
MVGVDEDASRPESDPAVAEEVPLQDRADGGDRNVISDPHAAFSLRLVMA